MDLVLEIATQGDAAVVKAWSQAGGDALREPAEEAVAEARTDRIESFEPMARLAA